MSEQIVVQIAKGWDNQTLVQLVRAPNVPEDDIGIMVFKCDPAALPSWADADAVKQHGQMLLNSLMQSHGRVKDALEHAFTLSAGKFCPIYLHLKALPATEVFCWEALCDAKGKFIALDQRWQVARIAGSPQLTTRTTADFEPPLRILVVLSALDRDPEPEWRGLYAAVTAARAKGLPIQVHVATGDEPLQDAILALSQTDANLSQFPLQDAIALIEEVDEFAPHLVHFFCHGSTSFAQPRLLLKTIQDQTESSIQLTVDDLRNSGGIRESWLTVLNCCESGAAANDVHSLTHSLVAGGLQAVIGMKETVKQLDAYEFSSRLYPGLLRKLTDALAALPRGDEIVIDWADALSGPRRALQQRHPAPNAREWTLPVLYAQPEQLRVRRNEPAGPAARAHEQTIEEVLALLPRDKRAAFEAELANLRAGH